MRDGEDKEAYEAQLAEALEIFEAKRAETADLQGLAAAQAGLESARAELEAERRGRDAAEREVHELRSQVCWRCSLAKPRRKQKYLRF